MRKQDIEKLLNHALLHNNNNNNQRRNNNEYYEQLKSSNDLLEQELIQMKLKEQINMISLASYVILYNSRMVAMSQEI